MGGGASDIKRLYCFHQTKDDSKCEVAHTSLPIRPSKSPAGTRTGTGTSRVSQEGNMAPKPKPARFVFAVGMALTIAAAMTWAVAEPSPSIYPIYQSQLPLLY